MTLSDPISDFIISIKNAGAAGKVSMTIPYSRMKMDIAEVLKKGKYISNVERHGRKNEKTMEVTIAYGEGNKPHIQGVKRISKPSKRVYFGKDSISSVKQGYGTLIISTPSGVMTGPEAQKKGIGGEALFEIW